MYDFIDLFHFSQFLYNRIHYKNIIVYFIVLDHVREWKHWLIVGVESRCFGSRLGSLSVHLIPVTDIFIQLQDCNYCNFVILVYCNQLFEYLWKYNGMTGRNPHKEYVYNMHISDTVTIRENGRLKSRVHDHVKQYYSKQ